MAPSLDGKVAVVAGASGIVGGGIVWSLLNRGAFVVAPLRNAGAKDQLLADVKGMDLEKLDIPIVDFSVPGGAAELAARVKDKFGTIDYAVSSMGAWWEGGPLTAQPLEEFNNVLQNMAGSHFVFVSHVAPLLRDSPESGYVFVSGGGGAGLAFPQVSLLKVGSCALHGVSLALRSEYNDKLPRVNEYRISMARIERHVDAEASKVTLPALSMMKPVSHRRCGNHVTDLLISDKKGEVLTVNGADDMPGA